jgi:hypothetical protein
MTTLRWGVVEAFATYPCLYVRCASVLVKTRDGFDYPVGTAVRLDAEGYAVPMIRYEPVPPPAGTQPVARHRDAPVWSDTQADLIRSLADTIGALAAETVADASAALARGAALCGGLVADVTGRALCPTCSVEGRRVMRRERGETRLWTWACGCRVEPTRVSGPEQRPACVACGADASRVVSRHAMCGECQPVIEADSAPLTLGRAHEWFVGGHGAGEFGPTRVIATERWRAALAEAQERADAA